MKYGTRHLKRAIERWLVHPLSNLIASGQVCGGDLIHIDLDPNLGQLVFVKGAGQMTVYAMVQMIEAAAPAPQAAAATTPFATFENPRPKASVLANGSRLPEATKPLAHPFGGKLQRRCMEILAQMFDR
jgi:hypothetical protein